VKKVVGGKDEEGDSLVARQGVGIEKRGGPMIKKGSEELRGRGDLPCQLFTWEKKVKKRPLLKRKGLSSSKGKEA